MNLRFDFTLTATDDPNVVTIGGTYDGEIIFDPDGTTAEVTMLGSVSPADGLPSETTLPPFTARNRTEIVREVALLLAEVSVCEDIDCAEEPWPWGVAS
jgi:hypothetical protein